MIKINGHEITPTIFPDGTSQVWKLPDEVFKAKKFDIYWQFENEREIIDVCSLANLVSRQPFDTFLYVPYLPYARQDKSVSNKSTFNLRVFGQIINSSPIGRVITFDAHNPMAAEEEINMFQNCNANKVISSLICQNGYDTLVFPDKGAASRYQIEELAPTFCKPIIFQKERDQLTGEITKFEPDTNQLSHEERLLIVDDLCDGGMTFIKVAQKLRSINPTIYIDLYVSHGIFSKGVQILFDAGIENVYTTNSRLQMDSRINVINLKEFE